MTKKILADKILIKKLNEHTLVLRNNDKIKIQFLQSNKTVTIPGAVEFIDVFSHRGNWIITSEYKNGLFGVDLIGEFKKINLLKSLEQRPNFKFKDMMSLYIGVYGYRDDLGYQAKYVSFQEKGKEKYMSISELIRSKTIGHKR